MSQSGTTGKTDTVGGGGAVPSCQERLLELGPGRKVHTLVAGQGPQVVYFPGNRCCVNDMRLTWPQIASHYQFIGIDPPGREPVQWPDEAFSFFDDLPGLYDRVLAEMDVGPHVAIGHSMGGMYALYHGRRHGPQKVRGLVLVEGFVTLDIHYQTAAPDGARAHRMPPAVAAQFERDLAANDRWIKDRPRFDQSFWPSQWTHDARPWVAELAMPILVLVGDNALRKPESRLPALQDLAGWRTRLGMAGVADLSVAVIPDAGHWMMLDDPQAFLAAVLPFLKRVLG